MNSEPMDGPGLGPQGVTETLDQAAGRGCDDESRDPTSRVVANFFLDGEVAIELVMARRVRLPVADVAIELRRDAPSTSPWTTAENSRPSRCRGYDQDTLTDTVR